MDEYDTMSQTTYGSQHPDSVTGPRRKSALETIRLATIEEREETSKEKASKLDINVCEILMKHFQELAKDGKSSVRYHPDTIIAPAAGASFVIFKTETWLSGKGVEGTGIPRGVEMEHLNIPSGEEIQEKMYTDHGVWVTNFEYVKSLHDGLKAMFIAIWSSDHKIVQMWEENMTFEEMMEATKPNLQIEFDLANPEDSDEEITPIVRAELVEAEEIKERGPEEPEESGPGATIISPPKYYKPRTRRPIYRKPPIYRSPREGIPGDPDRMYTANSNSEERHQSERDQQTKDGIFKKFFGL